MITRELTPGGWLLYRPAENVKACRHEWNEQVDFVAWVREWHPEYAALMFHPVNEGNIPVQYRQDQIKAGLLGGVSDIINLWPGRDYSAAVIEIKRCWWKSKPSDTQKTFLSAAADACHFAAVCNGAEAAKCAFIDYKKGLQNGSRGAKVGLQFVIGGGV